MTVEELFPDRTEKETEALFDAWAERDFEDIPTGTFFAALEEMEARHPTQHIEMDGEVVGDRLVFIPPKDVPLPLTVRDNEIILGDYTIRVRLRGVRSGMVAETSGNTCVVEKE